MVEESNSSSSLTLSSISFHYEIACAPTANPNELAAALATLQTLSCLMVDTLKQRGNCPQEIGLDWLLSKSKKGFRLSASCFKQTTGQQKDTHNATANGRARRALNAMLARSFPPNGASDGPGEEDGPWAEGHAERVKPGEPVTSGYAQVEPEKLIGSDVSPVYL